MHPWRRVKSWILEAMSVILELEDGCRIYRLPLLGNFSLLQHGISLNNLNR